MIATVIQATVYSPPMDPMKMVYVSPLNKKEDLVVETRTRNIRNNVILPVNVDLQTMEVIYQEHANN
jgi:hypothetical protein